MSGEQEYVSLRRLRLFKELCDEAYKSGLTAEEIVELVQKTVEEASSNSNTKIIKASDGIKLTNQDDGSVVISANIVAGDNIRIEKIGDDSALKISASSVIPTFEGDGVVEIKPGKSENSYVVAIKDGAITNDQIKSVDITKLTQSNNTPIIFDGGTAK